MRARLLESQTALELGVQSFQDGISEHYRHNGRGRHETLAAALAGGESLCGAARFANAAAALSTTKPGAQNSVPDEAQAREAAKQLLELGVQTVILKLGREGCVVAGDGISEHLPGFRVEAVDTTAAGDTFNGALAAALAGGESLCGAARFANAAAALSTTKPGAQNSVPDRDEVERLLLSTRK